MIEDGEKIYIIGGNSGSGIFQKQIQKLTCLSGTCSWTTLTQELKVARSHFVAIPVKDSACTPIWVNKSTLISDLHIIMQELLKLLKGKFNESFKKTLASLCHRQKLARPVFCLHIYICSCLLRVECHVPKIDCMSIWKCQFFYHLCLHRLDIKIVSIHYYILCFMTAYDYLWQLLTAFDSLWQLLTVYDSF